MGNDAYHFSLKFLEGTLLSLSKLSGALFYRSIEISNSQLDNDLVKITDQEDIFYTQCGVINKEKIYVGII